MGSTKEADLLLEAVSADESVSRKLRSAQDKNSFSNFDQQSEKDDDSSCSSTTSSSPGKISLTSKQEIKSISKNYLSAILTRDLIFMQDHEVQHEIDRID